MEFTSIIGYGLALLIGISLGLIGSGGSILTVPILVYIMKVEPFLATAYSLFIVGTSSLVGGIKNYIDKKVDLRAVALFGIPSVISVYITRAYLLPLVPDTIIISSLSLDKNVILMILFALVMFTSATKMIRPRQQKETTDNNQSLSALVIQGVLIGLLAGTVGAGGGFLIIPALVLFANMPMRSAVGTSLCIIAIQSLIGFLGDLQHTTMDWAMLLTFSLIAVIGIFIGIYLTRFIPDKNLKKGFGYFVLIMAIYILIKEVFL
ncbi:sulfite exporter TauE/SafE family protein [Myroides pelagicus]|uniref:Probable membrane transporter protein n=1 Tax=Myroides pelagicus TaxID=270914 RepID=A0A7K1GKT4_9FLAO|nr:sulfite exporter TauE/SafE family protein [Myroides pelagicus]MEC4112627.1 sulfite exporter TauE/SafE family protein [Myroides pelagicus]MTH29495.1 TSUP family transporter [Myroides pelagicus]